MSAKRNETAPQDRVLEITRVYAAPRKLVYEAITERDRSHLGIHGQHEPGQYYVGLSILGGRTSGTDLNRLADLAEEHGTGRVRTTNTQNVILLDIPERKLEGLTRDLDRYGFEYQPSWSRKAIIACTGIQFCKLALAETKNRAGELNDYLESAVDLEDAPRISVTGCPNASSDRTYPSA